MTMEKTQRKQSLNCLSNTPKLFDLNELLSSLKITPGQMGNMKGLIYIEGLTEKQVRQRLKKKAISERYTIKTASRLLQNDIATVEHKDRSSYKME